MLKAIVLAGQDLRMQLENLDSGGLITELEQLRREVETLRGDKEELVASLRGPTRLEHEGSCAATAGNLVSTSAIPILAPLSERGPAKSQLAVTLTSVGARTASPAPAPLLSDQVRG